MSLPTPESGRQARRPRREVWAPISADTDPTRQRQRARRVQRDVQLYATGAPCPACRGTARLSGGTGCVCSPGGETLAARCRTYAESTWQTTMPADSGGTTTVGYTDFPTHRAWWCTEHGIVGCHHVELARNGRG